MALLRRARGVRIPTPGGTVIGRLRGEGAAYPIAIEDLARQVVSTGVIPSVPAPSVVAAGSGIGVSYTAPTYTVSNTGVLSNIAGSGISVSGATGNVTIGNTGVLSVTAPAAGFTVNAATGAVTFTLANDLAALEALSSAGMAARTGTSTWAVRTITGPAAGITISNGDGVSGNPTLALANDLAALEALSSTGLAARTGTDTWAQRTITGTSGTITVTNGDGVSGNPTLTIDATYVGQSSITTLGTIATGTWSATTIAVNKGGTGQTSYTDGQLLIGNTTGNTLAKGSLTAPAAGITITGGAGAITFALANDLSALEGLSTTGVAVRTASDTWTTRTITGTANRLTVTNGDGVSGAPTLDISSAYVGQNTITTLGTIGTGTWQGTVIAGTYGGTGVNNGASTITIGGNVTVSGAFATTITVTATTNSTLPAGTHTLAGLDVAQTWSANQQFNSGNFLLNGSTSGTLTVKPAAAAGSNTLTLPAGTTDFSATGGTNQFVKQASAGSAFTVGKPSSAITGTTTNDNATAGDIGEEVEGVVLQASAITLTSTTATNITSISLTAGDWDVEGNFALNKDTGSTTQYQATCVSTISATFPAAGSFGRSDQLAAMFDNFPLGFQIGKVRLSLASTTTVYLVGYCIFSGTGAVTAWGGIIARRVR